jgi:hypothetical protein
MPIVRHPAFAALFATVAVAAAGTALAQVPDHVDGWLDEEPLAASIDQLRPDFEEAPYFESWDWWFHTDDGEFVYLQFVISTFGLGIERQGSLRGTAVSPGAVGDEPQGVDGVFRARRGFEWDDGEWTFSDTGFEVTFDDCYMRGDGDTFEVRMYDNTLKFEATVDVDGAMFRPGDGRIELGWDAAQYYDMNAIPRFAFDGRLSTRATRSADETWRDVSGVGYFEHTRTNTLPVVVAREWLGFRALRADGLSIVYDDVVMTDDFGGGRMPWLLVMLDGDVIFESYDVVFTPTREIVEANPPSNYVLPVAYEIVARSGADSVAVRVDNAALVTRDSILARVSTMLRAILSQTMNPMDYDYTVDYAAWLDIGGSEAQVAGRGWATFNFPR